MEGSMFIRHSPLQTHFHPDDRWSGDSRDKTMQFRC